MTDDPEALRRAIEQALSQELRSLIHYDGLPDMNFHAPALDVPTHSKELIRR